jgi:D-3-phosphoglycerate dehydrogenase
MNTKVLIADKFPDQYINELKSMNLDVENSPKLGANDLPAAAKDKEVLIVRSTVVTTDTIKSSDNLKLIIRAGAGVNNIDIPAATEKKVAVCNCPGKNSVAVAELAIGLMISLDRRIPDNVMDFNNGKWNKAEYSKAEGLKGKILGIVGVGNIGREVAVRANAFGMTVYGQDIYQQEGIPLKYFKEIPEMLPLCDVVSVHLPANAQTKGLFNKEMFSRLKPGAFFINTSRPAVIDENAMLDAIKEKNIKVALDVFNEEPEGKSGSVKSKLQNNPNIYITHHIGASTNEAQNAVAAEAIRIVENYVKEGKFENQVNK